MYGLVNNHHGANDRNAKMLFNMFESIQPSAYVHGHHHVAKTYGFRNCEFRSLDMCGGRKVQDKIADDAQAWFNACCAVWDTETNSWI